MAATRGAHRVVPLCRAVLAGKEVGRALSSGSGGKDSARDADMEALFGCETVGIKSTLQEVMGLDPSLFSSSETWSKPVDSHSLAEVEGNFYSTMDQSSADDIKPYTYGEKLCQARPPTEQMLSSATGLFFGELCTRFQKIEQMENEAKENKDDLNDYK